MTPTPPPAPTPTPTQLMQLHPAMVRKSSPAPATSVSSVRHPIQSSTTQNNQTRKSSGSSAPPPTSHQLMMSKEHNASDARVIHHHNAHHYRQPHHHIPPSSSSHVNVIKKNESNLAVNSGGSKDMPIPNSSSVHAIKQPSSSRVGNVCLKKSSANVPAANSNKIIEPSVGSSQSKFKRGVGKRITHFSICFFLICYHKI